MNKWIFIFSLLLPLSSCLKDSISDASSIKFKAYDEMLRCEPVTQDGHFRYIASNDSMSYLSQIDTMGVLKHLANYTSKCMSDIAKNSYSDSMYLLPAKNGGNYFMVFFKKVSGGSSRCFKLVKTDALGEVVYQVEDSLTKIGSGMLEFKKVLYNANNDGLYLFSTFTTGGGKDQESSVQMISYDSSCKRIGTWELPFKVGRNPFFIELANGSAGVFSGEIQGANGVRTQNFWNIDQNATIINEFLSLNATPGLITAALQTKDQSTIIFSSIAVDLGSGSISGNISFVNLTTKESNSTQYYPKGGIDLHYFNRIAQNNSDFLFIGNLDKTPTTMSWNSIYSQNDEAEIGWVLYGKSYERIGKGSLLTSLSFLGVGVSLICNGSSSFYGLAIKKSFGNYDNIVFFKTNISSQ